MKKHYTVDSGRKIVIAKIAKLTTEEVTQVKNYLAFGYELKEREKVKQPKFEQEAIKAYLETNGTPEQKKAFYDAIEETVIDKETGEPKLKKDGTPKKAGFIAGLKYFKGEFPDY